MKSIVLILVAILAIALASNVIVLTPENFDTVVDGSKNILVEFYAPWCGHCKHLEPEYEKAANALAGNDKVALAKVDADKHKDLGGRFGVSGFPTLKFFPKGWTHGSEIPYDGARTADSIVEWVQEHAGTKGKKSSLSNVVILTPENFDSVVLDSNKDVLVEFYAPWCGHCKNLAPDYEKVATAFKNEHHVVVANVDADKHKDLGSRFGVSGFPTIKFFPKDKKEGEAYSQGRDIPSFVKFLNERAGTHRTATGSLTPEAGRIKELDEIVSKLKDGDAGVLKEAQAYVDGLSTKDDDYDEAQFYLRAIQKQLNNKEFANTEKARLQRLIENPSTASSKIDEFTVRHNILTAFDWK